MARPREQNVQEEVRRLVGGRTQREIAAEMSRRLGRTIEHYQVSRMLTGARGVGADEMDALRAIAGASAHVAESEADLFQLSDMGDFVPLFGPAGPGSGLRLTEEHRLGVVPIHPAQRGSRAAFAFLNVGDAVAPRLNHGETGYAVRNRPPIAGQLALVELKSGDTMVRYFVHEDSATLFIKDKASPSTVALRDVAGIHAIVGATYGHA